MHNWKILIVDDEDTLALLYKVAFESHGCQVLYCPTAEIALQQAREFKPDLILLDLMMPRLDGFAAIELFRNTAETSNAVIVILSALSQPEDIARAKGLGANEYLVKAVTPMDQIIERSIALLGESKADLDPSTLNSQG